MEPHKYIARRSAKGKIQKQLKNGIYVVYNIKQFALFMLAFSMLGLADPHLPPLTLVCLITARERFVEQRRVWELFTAHTFTYILGNSHTEREIQPGITRLCYRTARSEVGGKKCSVLKYGTIMEPETEE